MRKLNRYRFAFISAALLLWLVSSPVIRAGAFKRSRLTSASRVKGAEMDQRGAS